MVLVVPVYDVEQEGVFYNTAFVIGTDNVCEAPQKRWIRFMQVS